MRVIQFLLFFLFSSNLLAVEQLLFTDKEKEYLASKQQITMCIDPDWLPFEAINAQGKHVGLSADFMAEYSKIMGIPIQLVPTKSWSESLHKAKARECDILSMLNESPERSAYLNFTPPYVTAAVALVSRSDVLFIDGLSALQGKVLAMPKNYIYEELIRRDYPLIQVVYTKNQKEAIKLVSSGKAYASIGTQISMLRDIQEVATTNVKVAGFTEYKSVLRVGVRKDDELLLSIFSKAVDNLPPQKTNEILQRWYSVTVQSKVDQTLLWQLLVVFFLISMIFVVRFRSIRQFNKILKEKNKQLERISQTDHLTGLFNRLKTDAVIKAEVARAERYGGSFCVMLFDIDHFKAVNDNCGHQIGDKVLIEISNLVRTNIRESDILGRWGGEEFMLVTPEMDIGGAEKLANKLRLLVQDHIFPNQIDITVSFGVAEYKMGDSPDALLNTADKMLYKSKEAGRNRVTIS